MRNKKIICLLAAWSMVLSAPGNSLGIAAAADDSAGIAVAADNSADIAAAVDNSTGIAVVADNSTGIALVADNSAGIAVAADMAADAETAKADTSGDNAQIDAAGDGIQTDAATGYSYKLYTETDTQKQWAEITGYAGESTALVIPASLGGSPVGRIGEQAFKGNETMVSLVISEGIYELGLEAFMGCTKLQSLTLPGTITSCYDRIFSGCTSLKDLELKEGMTMIGWREFEGCTALESVTIPSTITRWRTTRNSGGLAQTPHDCNVFNGCTALKKLEFTPGLKTLYDFAGVRDCPNLKELDIPASVENTDYAFEMCTYLEKITFHEGLESVGKSTFDECTALKEVQLPNSVTAINNRAFRKCQSLETLVLPPLAMDLGSEITSGCTALQELYLLPGAVGTYRELELGKGGKLYCMEGSRAYNMYLTNMEQEGRESQLATLADAGAKAEPYQGAYDRTAHQAVQMQGVQTEDQILYRIKDSIFQEEIPQLTEPGVHVVEVIVNRMNQGKIAAHSFLTVRARISKRQYEITLPDTTVTMGADYSITPQGYQGTEEPTFYYYKDEACQQVCDGKPETAGVYYVRAEVPENAYDLPVKSNVAKLTIQAAQQSTASPSPDPGTTATPTPEPSTSSSPSPEPSASSNPTSGPSTSSSPGPSASSSPGPSASSSPGPVTPPGTNPKPVTPPSQSPCPPPTWTEKEVSVKKVTLKGVKSPGKKKVTVRWKKVSSAAGYQIQVALNKKFSKGKKTYSAKKSGTKKTIGKLKSKKKYYVRIRAYRIQKGKRYYGAWSKVKGIKVK